MSSVTAQLCEQLGVSAEDAEKLTLYAMGATNNLEAKRPLLKWEVLRVQGVEPGSWLLLAPADAASLNATDGKEINVWEEEVSEKTIRMEAVGASAAKAPAHLLESEAASAAAAEQGGSGTAAVAKEEIALATLNQLIRHLTDPDVHDAKFSRTFLHTHLMFTSSEWILKKLVERFEVPEAHAKSKTVTRLLVCMTLRKWLEVVRKQKITNIHIYRNVERSLNCFFFIFVFLLLNKSIMMKIRKLWIKLKSLYKRRWRPTSSASVACRYLSARC